MSWYLSKEEIAKLEEYLVAWAAPFNDLEELWYSEKCLTSLQGN